MSAISHHFEVHDVDPVQAMRDAVEFLPAKRWLLEQVAARVHAGEPVPVPWRVTVEDALLLKHGGLEKTNAARYPAALDYLRRDAERVARHGKHTSILHAVAATYRLDPDALWRDVKRLRKLRNSDDFALT